MKQKMKKIKNSSLRSLRKKNENDLFHILYENFYTKKLKLTLKNIQKSNFLIKKHKK